MTLPDAKQWACLSGYQHWDRLDQPGIGIGGLTQGQRLWHHFHLECAIRQLAKFQQQGHSHCSFQSHFDRVSRIPVGR